MNVKQYFTSLNVLFLALLGGQIIFAALAFYLVSSGSFATGKQDLTMVYLVAAIFAVMGGVAGSIIMTNKQLSAIRPLPGLKEKLEKYQAALVVKYALLEGPAFFSIVCYLLTGYYLFLVLVAVVIAVFIDNRPSEAKVIRDLELEGKEREVLCDPEAVLN
jgi:hypothetical protein